MKDPTKGSLFFFFFYLNNDVIWKAETFGAVNSSAQISAPTQNTGHNSNLSLK